MHKFHKGDRVRVTSYGVGAYFKDEIVGSTGTVTDVLHEQVFAYEVEFDAASQMRLTGKLGKEEVFCEDELELADDGAA